MHVGHRLHRQDPGRLGHGNRHRHGGRQDLDHDRCAHLHLRGATTTATATTTDDYDHHHHYDDYHHYDGTAVSRTAAP
jgi:hypothetical protein